MFLQHARPSPTTLFNARHLVEFWAGKTLGNINGATCRAYVQSRPVKPSTCRRELGTLSAAIHWAAREHGTPVVLLSLPDAAPPRDRWLTRKEAAALLHAAWRQGNQHLVRFILLGLYTGTRHGALLGLQWQANTTGGWVDLERGLIYRRAAGEAVTNKRKPPVRLNARLAAHLRRWRAMDGERGHIVSWGGGSVRKERRAWHRARVAAGLGAEVTPHVMRHTCATWLMQGGVPTFEAAGYLGMTEATLVRVYGHHHPDFQRNAAEAF